MLDFILNWLTQQANFFLAPLYFHFGSSWFFIEIMLVLTDVIDLVTTYFLYFFILAGVVFFRNTLFISLVSKFFKTRFENFNIPAILSSLNTSLHVLFLNVFVFSKNILTRVKNKLKK